MPVKVVRWRCSFCGEEYKSAERARDCEALGFNPTVKVGDIVTCGGGFGWYDGDRRWITNPDVDLDIEKHHGRRKKSNCFDVCCTYLFYYVVTSIDGDHLMTCGRRGRPVDAHRPRYHLFTRAMKMGYRSGVTYDEGHYAMTKVKDPSAYLVSSARGLLGLKTERLI